MPKSEAQTRKEDIDPKIAAAGWNLNNKTQVDIEIPVDGYDAEPWNGISDYILKRENGEVLAVVEAKRTTRDPRLAQQQTEHYVEQIEKHQSFRPFAFMTNGRDIYFLDYGQSPKRQVFSLFSREDLERLLMIREQKKPLTNIPVNQDITNRYYQIEGIKRVAEAFENGKRRALLVMATGTGKTRTSMSLIDVFIRSNQARKILFVADRDALVTQAKAEGFETHIPSEPLERIFSTNIDTVKSNRLFVATLQTMSTQYDKFTSGFFDLIVFDEVHRSIFNKYKIVMDYFDARMIGLTATPADFIDRSTFAAFDCLDTGEPVPTYLYTYDQAIHDGYLVNYRLYRAQTQKQIEGIRAAYLTEEERNELIQAGLDPDDINYEGSELEKKVSNKDTLRNQWREFWEKAIKDQAGLPCKTIVFAMTQDHALRLVDVFEEMYPQYPNMARVITYKSEYKGKSIANFKREDMPRIAVSVDMLETGVNVPEVMNLVFMRPVQSRIKMQQMIGRGTRTAEAADFPERLPHGENGGEKDYFLIIDFMENEFGRDAEETVAQNLPVMVSLFNTRLKLFQELHLNNQRSDEAKALIKKLRKSIEKIPTNTFEVQKAWGNIEEAWNDGFWRHLSLTDINHLKNHVAPLLQFVPSVDVPATTFTHKIERMRLNNHQGRSIEGLINNIREDIGRLPDFVFEKDEADKMADFVFSEQLEHASDEELDEIIETFAPQMRNRRDQSNPLLQLDLADRVQKRGYVILNRTGSEIYVDNYRELVERHVVDMVKSHPTIQAIENGEAIEDEQLIELERTLREELGNSDLEITVKNIKHVYGDKMSSLLSLLRHVLDLDAAAIPDYRDLVKRGIENFIAEHEHEFESQQILFLKTVSSVLEQRGKLDYADLFEAPFSRMGQGAVERFFTQGQIKELLQLTDRLSA